MKAPTPALLERVPDGALNMVYLLHPDPWPKARHAKRRMVNPGPLDLIARKLKPGGEFRLGTDDPTYCRWSMMLCWRPNSAEIVPNVSPVDMRSAV